MHREMKVLAGLLTFQLIARGLDYLTGNPDGGVGAFEISSYTPAMVWGITSLTIAAAVIAGLVAGADRLVRNSAIAAMALYLSFAGLTVREAWSWPVDDWRFLTSYLTATGLWSLVAWSLTVSVAVKDSRKEKRGNGGDTQVS